MRRVLLLFSFGMLLALAGRDALAQTMAERYAALMTEYKNLENEWSTRFSEKMIRNAPSPDQLIVAKYLERPVWVYTSMCRQTVLRSYGSSIARSRSSET